MGAEHSPQQPPKRCLLRTTSLGATASALSRPLPTGPSSWRTRRGSEAAGDEREESLSAVTAAATGGKNHAPGSSITYIQPMSLPFCITRKYCSGAKADLIRLGSEREIKANNLMRQEPKDYVIKDGDIINIKFSV